MEDANYIIDYGDRLARSGFFEHIGLIAGFVLAEPICRAGQPYRPYVCIAPQAACGRDGNRFIINIPGRGYCFVAPTR